MRKIAHFLPAHLTLQNSMMSMYEREMPELHFDYYVIRLNQQPMAKLPEHMKVSVLDFSAPFNSLAELKKIVEVIDGYDYVVFHSMMLTQPMKVYISLFHPDVINKIVWIEWGYDIYIDRGRDWKGKLKYLLKRWTIHLFERRIPHFVAIHPADVEEYRTRIKGKAVIDAIPYRGSNGIQLDMGDYKYISLSERVQKNEPIYIQINHRADAILNHAEVLNCLSKFKTENIKVVLPLCYGDKAYGDAVEKMAVKIFGKKVICQREVVPYDEYVRLLERIDIFILNSDRQIALGNIHPMILMQKKIYLPENSVLYRYYTSEGDQISKIEDLNGADSFSEITKDVDTLKAKRHLEKYLNSDIIGKWRALYERLAYSTEEDE